MFKGKGRVPLKASPITLRIWPNCSLIEDLCMSIEQAEARTTKNKKHQEPPNRKKPQEAKGKEDAATAKATWRGPRQEGPKKPEVAT